MGDPDPVTWRKEAQRLLAPDLIGVDPMDSETAQMTPVELVSNDLLLIDKSAAIILNAARQSWGSAMEIFYANNTSAIPVVAFNVPPQNASLWLLANIDEQCASLSEAVVCVKRMLNNAT